MEPFGASMQDALEFEPKPKQLQVQRTSKHHQHHLFVGSPGNNRLQRAAVKLSVNISFVSHAAAKRSEALG